MHRNLLMLCAAGLVAGCAVVDPVLPTGPEQGYCVPAPAHTPAGRCPEGQAPSRSLGGEQNPGTNLEQAIAFLRDRRRQMSERERELVRLDSAARLGVAAGALTALGAATFGARPDLLFGAGLATGTSYVAGYGFAPAVMRNVYNAGIAALSCVETRALSAHITPVTIEATTRTSMTNAIQGLEREVTSARALPLPERQGVVELDDALTAADRALRSARDGLAGLAGAPGGPLIASAVYDRTLAIVVQVNSEVQRATPNLDAIVNLARQATSNSLDGVADAAAALRAAIAAPAQSPSPRRGAADTLAGQAITNINTAMAALATAASTLANELAQVPNQRLAQVRACAFQQVEGRGLTLFPGTTPMIGASPASETLSVAGGRTPYRISPTGTPVAGLTAEPEYSTGRFMLRNTGAVAGTSASFLVTDQGGESVVVTLTVR